MNLLKQTGVALFVLGAVIAAPAQAHHSFPATYFVDQSVTIEGTVVQFLFRNPHSFVHVLAPDKDGTMQRWAVEWGAGGALAQDNVSRDTLKPGDKVVIKGQPGRNAADHRIRMQAIEDKTANWKWAGTFG
jgi:DNA/RNA endonuclease YhcR with UshA esterase domain